MDKNIYDLCIIGGGINGCGIARDAAGRGYRVLLLEKDDLASATSSASTKLIHGGLRYLEQYEFSLVRKSLKERDVLMNIAPHIIRPARFILPYVSHLRPLWMIRLGIGIYDFLAGRSSLEKSSITNINNKIINKTIKKGIEYSDCKVDDSRLVVLNAMDAKMRGVDVNVGQACTSINKGDECWDVKTSSGDVFHAQMIVNASGPWASKIMKLGKKIEPKNLRLVKGSHIIIPKLYKGEDSYILQIDDGRIVFTIPYEGDYTLIGTTDVDLGDDPDQEISINEDEINYLKNVINKYFNKTIKGIDIIDTYSGVRPLIDGEDSASKLSRDYELDLQIIDDLPFLSVLGGKLTTYRILSQEVVDMIDEKFHKIPKHWTKHEKLPGGDLPDGDMDRFINEQVSSYPFLSTELITRYAKSYGTCMNIILDRATCLDDMGADIGGGVYGRELDYLIAYEFAKTGEDVLKRRSKLYLHLDKSAQNAVSKYMKNHA